MNIRSLAALKRYLQPGVRLLLVVSPPMSAGRVPNPWPREVAKSQTNAIAFKGDEVTKGRLSWVWWPKASLVSFQDDGFIVHDESGDDRFRLVYKYA